MRKATTFRSAIAVGMVGVVDVLHVFSTCLLPWTTPARVGGGCTTPTIVDRGTAALVAAERIGKEVAGPDRGQERLSRSLTR